MNRRQLRRRGALERRERDAARWDEQARKADDEKWREIYECKAALARGECTTLRERVGHWRRS